MSMWLPIYLFSKNEKSNQSDNTKNWKLKKKLQIVEDWILNKWS